MKMSHSRSKSLMLLVLAHRSEKNNNKRPSNIRNQIGFEIMPDELGYFLLKSRSFNGNFNPILFL